MPLGWVYNLKLRSLKYAAYMALVFYTAHVQLTTELVNSILTGPFSVMELLGVKYLAVLVAWIIFVLYLIFLDRDANIMLLLGSVVFISFLVYSIPRSLFYNQFYVDTIGFIIEAKHVAETGHFKFFQGGLESSGHAFFTGILIQLSGLNWYLVTQWIPHIFMYLTIIGLISMGTLFVGDKKMGFLVPMIYLAMSFFTMFHYNRQSFSFFLHLVSLISLLLLINGDKLSDLNLLLVLFVGLLVSHPGSSFNVVLLTGASYLSLKLWHKSRGFKASDRTALLFSTLLVMWLTFQLFLVEGSMVSFVRQTFLVLSRLYEEPLPYEAISFGPGLTEEGRLYYNMRLWYGESLIILMFLLSILILKRKYRTDRMLLTLAFWILLDVTGTVYGVYAHRWAHVPFMYMCLVAPLFVTIISVKGGRTGKIMRYITVILLLIGISLQPVLMWGPAPFMMPPSTDLSMINFLTSHTDNQNIVNIGGHTEILFYQAAFGERWHVSTGPDYLNYFINGLGFPTGPILEDDMVGVFFRAYAKAGFLKFIPPIEVALRKLSMELIPYNYNRIYMNSASEWLLFRGSLLRG